MALQFQLESLEGLDELTSKLYIEKDGKYVLDVTGHEQAEDKNSIPKSRLDQEISKRKDAEKTLNGIADELLEDIPEDMRDIVPDLPPAQKIKWIRDANKKGFFNAKTDESGPDSKRPGGKAPNDFKDMSPQAIMATGYKTK